MINSWWRHRFIHYMVIGRLLSHVLVHRSEFGGTGDIKGATFLDAVWHLREKAQDERNEDRLAAWQKKWAKHAA